MAKEWEAWPLYVQKRYALDKTELQDPKSVLSPTPAEDAAVDALEVVTWTYGVLATLDSKASALMRLNGVLIAAAAFLLGLFDREGGTILSTTSVDAILIIVSAVLSALSISLCLFVVNVGWTFLGKVEDKGNGRFDFAKELKGLDESAQFRQTIYRVAWLISLFASLGFLGEFLLQSAYVVYFSLCGQTLW